MAGASYINAAEAASIRQEFRNLEATVEAVFWDVAWTAWTKDRPETGDATSWNKGTAAETWKKGGTGAGRLRPTESGGPASSEDVIYAESPFRLRTSAAAAIDANTWLVIEGRLFKVDAFKPRGGDRTHAYAYLTELFVPESQMPSEVPAP